MTLIKENKGVRKEIPNRMMCATFAIPIDGRKVTGTLDYIASETSRCLQNNESLKDLVDTLSQDNVIGQMANYLHKNMEDIILGKQPDKKQRMLSTDPYAMKE